MPVLIFTNIENISSIITWIIVICIITILFALAIYYIQRSFSCRIIFINIVEKDKVVKTDKKYFRIGSEVNVSAIDLPKDYEKFIAYKIECDANIKEGSLTAFKMPKSDVNIFFRKQEIEEKKLSKKDEKIKMRNIPIPQYIKKKADRETIPVILMKLNEVKSFLRKSNKQKYFPVLNSYKCAKSDDKDVLILYNGDLIYAILIYSDITFKVFFKSDANYVNESMEIVDSLVKVKDDIYSFVLDYSFETKEQFFAILNHAYEYVLYISYVKVNDKYMVEKETIQKYNSEMLSLNIEISREFDPVFDRAIADAKKFQRLQQKILAKRKELDYPLPSTKQKVIEEIEKNSEYINPHTKDDYIAPINITDEKYFKAVKNGEESSSHDLPEVLESLKDIPIIHPAKIAFDKIIEYIMMRKDMVSLTIDVPRNIKKGMAQMKFISSSFALICLKNNQYVIFMKLDENYVKNQLLLSHKNVKRVRNGDEYDWYKVILDNSFTSYEEIYNVILSSYEYTKKCYYRRYS